jgi:hypothetical protein
MSIRNPIWIAPVSLALLLLVATSLVGYLAVTSPTHWMHTERITHLIFFQKVHLLLLATPPSRGLTSHGIQDALGRSEDVSLEAHVANPDIARSNTNRYPDISPNTTMNLLDFTVAGFAKCGTTFLMRDVLGASKHVYMGYQNSRGQYKEMHHLENDGQLPQFLTYFQSQPRSSSIKHGFKAPNTLMFDEALAHLATYFPTAKFIVSVRHPILWFQSNYNYKMRLDKYASDPKITPHNRIGECKGSITNQHGCDTRQSCVAYQPGFGCTDLSNWHIHLSRLGWTPRNSTREVTLLHHRMESTFDFTQSKMFILELGQLDPRKNNTGTVTLVRDLEHFLDLPPNSLPDIQPPKETGPSKHTKKAQGNHLVLSRMIHICDEEYTDLRQVLLQQAKEASEWILDFFLSSPHVTVSNREYFTYLLNQWKVDPCSTMV